MTWNSKPKYFQYYSKCKWINILLKCNFLYYVQLNFFHNIQVK